MNYLKNTFIGLLICVLTAPQVWAEYNSSRGVLDNGLTVLVTEMPASPNVSVYCLVKTGSATEGKYLGTGISHFLEHMLFKETKTRKVGEIASFIQSVGGTINASTSFDYTIYTVDVPYDQFDNALAIVSDMMQNTVFSETEFLKERDVIFGEMRLHEDNPDRVLGQMGFANVYKQHTYQHPIIGYKNSFSELNATHLADYYKIHYVPTNMILSVAGRINTAEIRPKIEEAFKNAPREFAPLRNLPEEPAQISTRKVVKEFPTDLTRISLAFQGIRLLDQDLYALDVLANILGSGRSSRLYKKILKEKQLVYQISAGNYTPFDKGYFEIEALLDAPNLDKVIEEVESEIKNVQSKSISPQELQKAKKRVVSDHIFALDTSSGVAYAQALDEAIGGDYQFSKKYVEHIQKLKTDDIQRVANQYLKPQALSVSVLFPETEQSLDPLDQKQSEASAVEKIMLENGLIILLRVDKSLPLVNLRASLNGGLLQEPEGLEGLSQLSSNVWTKATRSKNSEQLSELTDTNGFRLGPFSGRNSLGFTLETLSEDFNLALDLFEEILKKPAFNEEDISLAKKMTLASLQTRKDSIFTFTNLNLNKLLFENHPYRHDALGTPESLAMMNKQQIEEFYSTLVRPQNIVISVFGDIDREKTLKLLRDKFGVLKKGELVLKQTPVSTLQAPKESLLKLNRQQTMIMVGFQAPSVADSDRHAVEILTDLLGSSFSGQLFRSVREELGKAYSVGGQYIPGIGTGSIIFFALTDSTSAQKVKEIMMAEIEKTKNISVVGQELLASKTFLKDTFWSDLETQDTLSLVTSLDELYGLGYDNYLKYGQKIDAVTASDIQRVAKKYLDLSKVVTVITSSSD